MTFLAAYLHRIDPFAVGPIRWYGLSYLAGFLVAYFLVKRVTRAGISTLQPQRVGDLVAAVAVGIVVGGRLGYVIFYRPDLWVDFSSQPPFWGVLAINQGGMASHGGILGGIIATWWFARKHGHNWPHMLDLMAFAAGPGLFFGRIANFINGELLGRPCGAGLPWAVKFPQEIYQWDGAKLAQLQPVADRAMPQLSSWPDVWSMHLEKIVEQVQAGNQRVIAALEPLLTPRHPSQLYAAMLEGALVLAVLAAVWWKPRKPLVIGSLFCVVYAVARIFDEMFRLPDAHIGYQWLGLTRGQWLSVFLLAAGLVLLVIFSRRNVPVMGGWRAPAPAIGCDDPQADRGESGRGKQPCNEAPHRGTP